MSTSANNHEGATPTIVWADDPLGDESTDALCVCGHPRSLHDAISTRYCDATVTGGLSRGCVCSAVPGNYPGRM